MASKRRLPGATSEEQTPAAGPLFEPLAHTGSDGSSAPDTEDSACTKKPRMKRGVKAVAMKIEKPAVPRGIDEDLDNKLGVASDRVYHAMLELEQERPRRALVPTAGRPTTPYLRCRHSLVKYLATIICELGLCRGALHLGVRDALRKTVGGACAVCPRCVN